MLMCCLQIVLPANKHVIPADTLLDFHEEGVLNRGVGILKVCQDRVSIEMVHELERFPPKGTSPLARLGVWVPKCGLKSSLHSNMMDIGSDIVTMD
jgi:hypothetical protein